jgi:hypothetical protein
VDTRATTLSLRIQRGEMVSRRAAEAAHFALGTRIRDQLLTAPARHAAMLAARYDLDPGLLMAALDGIVRSALVALADRADVEEPL